MAAALLCACVRVRRLAVAEHHWTLTCDSYGADCDVQELLGPTSDDSLSAIIVVSANGGRRGGGRGTW